MRIASFNVENLFERAKAINAGASSEGRATLERHARINTLLGKSTYTDAIKAEIAQLLAELGLAEKDDGGEFALLRQNRGRLVKRPKAGGMEIVAAGRADWVGWVELKMEPVNEVATRHTAMVIKEVGAHVQAVVEADNRTSLRDFSRILLPAVKAASYEHVMLIDGNDDRGIDVGMLTSRGHEITGIRSHVEDSDDAGVIFSRDCPEFTVTTPAGGEVVVLVNHLKSKGFGSAADSNAKRERQARRVAKIYRRLRDEGRNDVAVVGDFNDTPDSGPLRPLLGATDLLDISTHEAFVSDGRPGTFANGTKGNKIDYVLLSPSLFARVTGGGVFRKGVWGGKHGTLFPHFPSMVSAAQAASDHAAIFADVDV